MNDVAGRVCRFQALGNWEERKKSVMRRPGLYRNALAAQGQGENINRSTVGGLLAPVIDLVPKKDVEDCRSRKLTGDNSPTVGNLVIRRGWADKPNP